MPPIHPAAAPMPAAGRRTPGQWVEPASLVSRAGGRLEDRDRPISALHEGYVIIRECVPRPSIMVASTIRG
jgi:hypothetical protein